MRCYQARARLSAYIDGELETGATEDLATHLRQCLYCQEALNDLQRFDDDLRQLPRIDLGPNFFNGLSARLGERGNFDRADLPEALPAGAKPSRLADILIDFFGPGRRSGDDPLEEFSDFPPLSIGSAYFTVFGQPEN
jgi:hypothetical protein